MWPRVSGDANIYAKCNDMVLKNEHMVHSLAAEHILEVRYSWFLWPVAIGKNIPLQYDKLEC